MALHGHGLRDRLVLGVPELGATPTAVVVGCRRYLCTACGAVVMVVPRGIEPRRHYGRATICLALALWALAGESLASIRGHVAVRQNPQATSWRSPRRWAAAVAAGHWEWCRAAANLPALDAAGRAAQIAAGRAPPMTSGPVWELAYAGGATLT